MRSIDFCSVRYMMWGLLALAFQTGIFAQAGEQIGSAAAATDRLLKPYTVDDAPGISVAVYRRGEIVYAKAAGMADLEHHVSLSTESVFEIASMSKQFTAFAVVLLAEDGKLSLDDDIRTYLPELQISQKVTIRQLLQHTSGIRDYIDLMILSGRETQLATASQDDVLATAVGIRDLNFAPGTSFRYENTSYALMATLVRRVSGTSLREFAADRIFQPLGMNSTRFQDDHTELIVGRAMGYSPDRKRWKAAAPLYDEVGDGGVWTTVEDLAKWDRNFYEPRVGGEAAIRIMLEPATLTNGERRSYALGLFVQQRHGLPMVSHGGVDPGYRAQMLRFPTKALTVAVLGNNAEFDIEGLANRIADIYLGQTAAAPKAPAAASAVADRERFIGKYLDETSGRVREIVADEKGIALRSGGNVHPLAKTGPRLFEEPSDAIRVSFEARSDETWMTLRWVGTPVSVSRRMRASPHVVDDLSWYAGIYASRELGVSWTIALKDQGLVVTGPGVKSSLVHLDASRFKTDMGLIAFTRDESGRAAGFSLSNVRDSGIAFVRSL